MTATNGQIVAEQAQKPDRMARLTELEDVVRRGLSSVVEVGRALMEIRNKRLYREMGFSTFEDYCRDRWKWTRQYANRQIRAAELVEMVPMGTKLKNERQARELVGLKEAEVRQVAERVDFSQATAKEVRAAATEITAERRGIRKDKTAPYNPESDGQHRLAEAQKKKMVYGLSSIDGLCDGLGGLDILMAISVCDVEEIRCWSAIARESAKTLQGIAERIDPTERVVTIEGDSPQVE